MVMLAWHSVHMMSLWFYMGLHLAASKDMEWPLTKCLMCLHISALCIVLLRAGWLICSHLLSKYKLHWPFWCCAEFLSGDIVTYWTDFWTENGREKYWVLWTIKHFGLWPFSSSSFWLCVCVCVLCHQLFRSAVDYQVIAVLNSSWNGCKSCKTEGKDENTRGRYCKDCSYFLVLYFLVFFFVTACSMLNKGTLELPVIYTYRGARVGD